MSYEVVVGNTLTQEMITAGEELTKKLMESPPPNLTATGSMWYYDSPKDLWKFVVLTPDVIVLGSRESYIRFHRYLDSFTDWDYEINWQDILLFPDSGGVIEAIRSAVSVRGGQAKFRLRNSTVKGILIEDVLVYWIVSHQ